ncbi:hypothetical protein, partial [Enterobacter hormaechei]|uniref:hypothetical protein n=1 Tax=Enterobacter hormaechei TaxID=158836 RepID=UPI001D14E8A2
QPTKLCCFANKKDGIKNKINANNLSFILMTPVQLFFCPQMRPHFFVLFHKLPFAPPDLLAEMEIKLLNLLLFYILSVLPLYF